MKNQTIKDIREKLEKIEKQMQECRAILGGKSIE
jgi:hypothetical protein